MSQGIPEADWKVFRELRVVALERFCERILAEARAVASGETASAHERFLKLYAHVNDRNDEVAHAFDNPRRSSMLIQLAAICRSGVLQPEELSRFSTETREIAESLARDR